MRVAVMCAKISGYHRFVDTDDSMGLEESKETWTRVNLFCDGIGKDSTSCVAYGDPHDDDSDMPMVTDCCQSSEDARRLALCAAERQGWQFDLKLKRWLCPACVATLREGAPFDGA
jgi:hypothetical protein